jgi:hypothetical protein
MISQKLTGMSGGSSTSGEVSVDPQAQASLLCGILLSEAQQDEAQAEQDRVAVESDFQQAYNLFKMAQAANDPKQKLALATQGLAVLTPVTQLIQDAQQAAADADAALAEVKTGIQGVSCGAATIDSAQQAADAAAEAAQALNDPTYRTVIGLLQGALQNVRDAAQAQVAVPLPPSSECIQTQGTWYGGVNFIFDEKCTQQLIEYLDDATDLSAVAGTLVGAVGGATIVGALVAAALAALALSTKLVEHDTKVADTNQTGVTWHFSPIPLAAGGAFELNTLLTELAYPGFGNEWISVLWITGNG